ncbi:zinc finger BED domain-containing protein RICESLEEPER 2-like [Rhizophagus clarus]|nr:zinc finger BED domain-containing protein RICESLEEPER 2-like [Rhizophagus clarus]
MESDQYMLAELMNQKIEKYWMILDGATTIAIILDLQNKITLFELGEPITKVINTLKEKYSLYYSKVSQPQTSIPNENNNTSGRKYFYQLKKWRLGEATEAAQAEISPSNNPDFAVIERYLALLCDENVEVLLWWQAHSIKFLVLSLMARDYLVIQFTSVAYEQAFSIAGNTITKTQNQKLQGRHYVLKVG